MFKNGHLRLLMKLVGMERLAPSLDETPESTWVIPAGITSDRLKESVEHINKAEFSPPVFEDNASAEDQLRRKTAPRKRAVFDDDDDGLIDDEDGLLFPMGGPTARKVIDGDKAPKKSRRRRRKGTDELEEMDDEVLKERARQRRERELAKARKIKSELYVHPSDDETDNEWSGEFMAQEEAKYKKIQQDLSSTLKRLLDGDEGEAGDDATQKKSKGLSKSRKRKSAVMNVDSDDDSAEDTAVSAVAKPRKRTKKGAAARAGTSSDDDEMGSGPSTEDKSDNEMATDDTPLSSSPHVDGTKINGAPSSRLVGSDADEDDDDELLPAPAKRRPRVAVGFLVDSSDEE